MAISFNQWKCDCGLASLLFIDLIKRTAGLAHGMDEPTDWLPRLLDQGNQSATAVDSV
jgi:hypothetical protein